MRKSNLKKSRSRSRPANSKTSEVTYLNAYEIKNLDNVHWNVTTYTVVTIDGTKPKHEDRGKNKDIIWGLRAKYKDHCKGYGFVIDVDEVTVAVPGSWEIPRQDNFEGFRVVKDRTFDVKACEIKHSVIIEGILRESIKSHFKKNSSEEIGVLWRDFGDYCQMPKSLTNQNVAYCRKFKVSPELLRDGRYVFQIEISTTSIDGRTFEDYYRHGEVQQLAEKIKLKQANRLTRRNESIAIRAWHLKSDGNAEVLELENPDEIIKHALLTPADQTSLANQTVACKQFKKPLIQIPARKLRLILDSQIAQEDHAETIIEPQDRYCWYEVLRNFLNGLDAYGCTINLPADPIRTDEFEQIHFNPPNVRIRTSPNTIGILDFPPEPLLSSLKTRAKQRSKNIRQFGYLEHRPINPLLAIPKIYGNNRTRRLKNDLNYLFRNQGIPYRFGKWIEFSSTQEIVNAIEKEDFDSLFAVLPEGRFAPQSDADTHEKIKKRIEVPSQCIQHDNTLPIEWVDKDYRELRESNPYLERRIKDRYHQCLLNLLVKHNWVPFAPAEPFHYNIHVGIDVGGKHNTTVMACIGYGLSNPEQGIIFLPGQIDIDVQQAEPIPTQYLYNGLITLFESLRDNLAELKLEPDFNKVLFFRDGELRGKGDDWNEIDALMNLRKELRSRNWIDDDALWTAAEVSKRAGNWRLTTRVNGAFENPIVGKCVFPFIDQNKAIVSTTGRPYLSQGTASPLVVQIRDIYRKVNREHVIRDLIWEADMCFTKLDMGMSLPWVLHVANEGALQQSKAYKITGITV